MKQSEKWARAVFNGEFGQCLILDTETTGLDSKDEVIQVAVIDLDGRTYYDQLIKPTVPITAGAAAIHGITNEMVASALPLSHPQHAYLFDLLRSNTILVYNADYDRRILSQSYRANKIGDPTVLGQGWHCVMKKYASFYGQLRYGRGGGYRWQSLTDACHQQGIPVSNAHNALGDCLMTLELLGAMAGVREKVQG